MQTKAIVKPTRPRHWGSVSNRMSFEEAFTTIQQNRNIEYLTMGNKVPFTVEASTVTRGKHKGHNVLIFRSRGREMARAYSCCWGHITNCNRTYIDCYTCAL